jgi:hypothetical protein
MGKNLSMEMILFAFIVEYFYPFFGVYLTNKVYYWKYYIISSTFLTFPKDEDVVTQQQNYFLECFSIVVGVYSCIPLGVFQFIIGFFYPFFGINTYIYPFFGLFFNS